MRPQAYVAARAAGAPPAEASEAALRERPS